MKAGSSLTVQPYHYDALSIFRVKECHLKEHVPDVKVTCWISAEGRRNHKHAVPARAVVSGGLSPFLGRTTLPAPC